MDGLGRAAGSGVPIKLGEQTYYMSAFSRQSIGEIEQKLLADRKSYLDIAKEKLEGLPTHLQQDLLREALKQDGQRSNYVTDKEMTDFMDSTEGIAYTLWMGLRQNHPDMTLERIYEIIQEMGDEEIKTLMERRDQAATFDEAGNGIGLPLTEVGSKATTSSSSTNGEKASSKSTEDSTGDSTIDKSLKPTQESPTPTSTE